MSNFYLVYTHYFSRKILLDILTLSKREIIKLLYFALLLTLQNGVSSPFCTHNAII